MTARSQAALFCTLVSPKRAGMSISRRFAGADSFLGKGGRLYWALRICR
jgi:hypothetical protein